MAQKAVRPSPEIIQSPAYTEKRYVDGVLVFQGPKSYQRYKRLWVGSRTANFRNIRPKSLPMVFHSSEILWDGNSDATDSRRLIAAPFSSTRKEAKTLDIWTWMTPLQANHSLVAVAKADRKIISEVSNSGGLAIDLAQLGQTVNLVANNILRIVESIRRLKRGNIKGAITALGLTPKKQKLPKGPFGPRFPQGTDPYKNLARLWLELQYGWKPLLNDVRESFWALEKFLERNPWVVRAEAKGKDLHSFSKTRPPTVGSFGWNGVPLRIGVESHKITSSCKYVLYYRRDDHATVLTAELGLRNPVDLAWEVLPFSFVVDWFLPIGPWLEALHAYDGLVFVKGSKTQFVHERAQMTVGSSYTYQPPFQPFASVEQRGDRQGERILVKRTPLSAFPANNPPVPKSPVSVTHAANALALLVAIFKE